jgi:tRNA modification GTPase
MVVAIAGPPNAGKSSLLNRLARREAAIVSPYAGTTRDVIEVHLDLGGYPVVLLDTAGIRESDDPVEQEGIRRAQARAAAADLVLWVVEEGMADSGSVPKESGVVPEAGSSPRWIVRNKVDLHPNTADTPIKYPLFIKNSNPESGLSNMNDCSFSISAKAGIGLSELTDALAAGAAQFFDSTEAGLLTRQRQREALSATLAQLDRALQTNERGRDELLAEELRLAARALGRLTGRVDVEDVLDVIFRDFCIGK